MFLGLALLVGWHVRFSLTMMFLLTALVAELLAVWRLTRQLPRNELVDPDLIQWRLIEVGMTEKDVERIMGRRGGEMYTQTYSEWQYPHGIVVQFQDGRVKQKYRFTPQPRDVYEP
jgi:hypothetical protein